MNIILDFSSETMEDNRQWNDITEVLKETIIYLKFYNPKKYPSKLWQNKDKFK